MADTMPIRACSTGDDVYLLGRRDKMVLHPVGMEYT
jgi:hypothetical protein